MEPVKEEKLGRKSLFKTPSHLAAVQAVEERKVKAPSPKTPGSSDQTTQTAKHRIAALKRFLPKPVSALKRPVEDSDTEDEDVGVLAKMRPETPQEVDQGKLRLRRREGAAGAKDEGLGGAQALRGLFQRVLRGDAPGGQAAPHRAR